MNDQDRNAVRFRIVAVLLALNYWSEAGVKLVDGGGSFWGWVHVIVACMLVTWFVPNAWQFTRPWRITRSEEDA